MRLKIHRGTKQIGGNIVETAVLRLNPDVWKGGVSYMIEETLRFIESEEVRNYLREFLKTFGGITEERKRVGHRRLCSSIVCFAPAPVEQKILVLDLIAVQTKSNPEGDSCDPAKFAKEYRMALEERYNNPLGTVFRLRLCHYNESGYHGWSDALFTEFDAAVRCIKEHSQTDSPHNIYHLPDACGFLSYTIDKCVPGENGMMEEYYCTWILNASGKIWYFDYGDRFKPEDWVDMIDYGRRSVEFPVPFQPGDIVTIDCCPFVHYEHVLVTGYDGFERHLAPMECLYTPPSGKILYTGSINDNAFLTQSPVSGYYRIARHQGALRPYEAPLAVISTAAQWNPKLPEEISGYIREHGSEANGIEWERIRQEFAL